MSFLLRGFLAGTVFLGLTCETYPASGAPAVSDLLQEYKERSLTEREAPALIKMAEQGDGKAQLILGRSFMNGDGVPEDMTKGLYWLSLAAKNGYAKNVEMWADSSLLFLRGPDERKTAKALYRSVCDAGEMGACGMLGTMLLEDREDVKEGLSLLRKAAGAGRPGAQLMLGKYLGWVTSDTANIVPRNDAEAFKWLLKAANQGIGDAMCRVGEFYEAGRGTHQDLLAARQWYERGARLANLGCELALGEMYEFGKGVPQDGDKAIAIYRTVADRGAVNAHEYIGRIYEFGRGVPQSYSKAFKWYDAGRLMLESETAYRLGVFCEEGKVVPRDVEKAREYYKDSRTADAALRLGESYANETAPLRDMKEAMTWLLVAKKKGCSRANEPLARVAAQLSPAQRASAEAEAQEWIEFDEE